MSDEKKTCPNCGYCPTCGRSPYVTLPTYPIYPQPWTVPYPHPHIWWSTGTGTTGGMFDTTVRVT